MDDSCVGIIVVICVIIAVIGYIIMIAAYLALIALGVFAVVGIVCGLIVAIKCFVMGITTAQQDLKIPAKDKVKAVVIKNTAERQGNYSGLVFEEVAKKSFFWGPCFAFIGDVFTESFKHLEDHKPEFGLGDTWWKKVLFFFKSFFQLFSSIIIAGVLVFVLSAVLTVVFLAFASIAYVFMALTWAANKLFFTINKVSIRCNTCKNSYTLPLYKCPTCGIFHAQLKPGYWGMITRKCICGTVLPLTTYARGNDSGKRISLRDLKGTCPYCGKDVNAGISRPVSIALIGGQSAGKTTFQIAFLRDFVNDELTRCNIDYDFPDEETKIKFDEYEKAYIGRPIAATQRGIDADVTSFNMKLSQKSFSVERMMQIFDMPGEVFLRGDAKEGNQLYTIENGAVFVLDPYSISGVRNENEKDITGNTMGICNVDMNDLVQSLIDAMRSVRTKTKDKKFILPIAVAINKVDTPTLRKQTGQDAVEALMKAHPDIFPDKYLAMDYVCRCFLSEKGGDNFILNLDNNFNTVHFFFCSPMGYVPKGTLSRFKPVNVMAIMRWMMLRADKQFEKVWTGGDVIRDLTDDEKAMYKTSREYYDEYITKVTL